MAKKKAKTGKVKPITAAVLGLGRSGWGIHIFGVRGRKDYVITDVADPIAERRKQAEEEFGCNSYATVEECIKKSKAELVMVATQSSDHCKHTIMALKAGKHVLVEKPMALKYSETKRMVEQAKKSRRKLFVHQNYRWNPIAQFMRLFTEKKSKIGKIFNITYQSYSFVRRNDWQTLKKYGGGLLNNKLTHILDTLFYVTDSKAINVLADMQHTTDSGNVEDHVSILIKTDKGITLCIQDSSSCKSDGPAWILMGETGTVTVPSAWGSTEAVMNYFDPRKHKKLKPQDRGFADNRAYGNKEKLRWYSKKLKVKGEDLGDYYDNIVDVLRKKGTMVVKPEQVVEMTRMIEECRKQNPEFKM